MDTGCNDKVSKNEIEDSKVPVRKVSDSDIPCQIHPLKEGGFYCKECRDFFCNVCFVNNHKTHNCSIYSEVVSGFNEELKTNLAKLGEVKAKIDQKHLYFTELNGKLKKLKQTSKDNINSLQNAVSNAFAIERQKLTKEFEKLYKNSDSTVEGFFNSILSFNKKYKTVYEQIKELLGKMEMSQKLSTESATEICKLHKQSLEKTVDARKTIENGKTNFSEGNLKAIKGTDSKLKAYIDSINSFKKISKNFEENMISNVVTGRHNQTIRMRRFSYYSINKSYFNQSSVQLTVDRYITIAAFGICALAVNESDRAKVKLSTEDEKKKMAKSIEVMISIFELERQGNKQIPNLLLRENGRISTVFNIEEPTNYFYLKNTIWLRPGISYLFTLKNLDQEKYQDFYLGEVFEELHLDGSKTIQEQKLELKCNSSGIKFEFSSPIGFESDFNELCSGLLGDIIYNF